MVKLIRWYVRVSQWAARPLSKFKSQIIPGVGLEVALIGLHLVIGLGHLVLYFRG